MPNEKEYDGEGCDQAVMEKEQTYRVLVENILQQIFIKGTDYVYQSCNENFANDLGLSQEDIVGMTDYDLFPGQFADAFRADDRRVIESGSTEIIEEPYESRGKKRWAHTVKTPLRDSQGKINGILGIYSDITEQKELHEALQNSEANLRSIFEAVTEPVFMLSTDGTVIDSNEEFASKLGKTRKDLINHCVYDYLPPDVAERSKAWVEKIISSGKPFITEDHRMGHDLEHSMYPIFDENKSVRNIAVFVRDVTEFKQIERALRDSEERWKFALEGARNGVWDWNIETGQLFESEQCRAINGYQSHEMTFNVEERLGKIHPEDIEEFTCSLRAHFHGETPFFENDHRSLAADGCYKWISARGKVMGWSDDGKPLRMLGTITDIGKRKQMEVELQQAKDNLEQTVNQRTAELMEANKRLARELEERRLAQLALQQSEERFRLLFKKSEAVLLLIDPDSGNILDANETASKYYGYSHKTICEMSIHEINCLPPEEVLAERQLAKTEKRNYFVFPHRLSSGEMRTVEVYSSPVKINGHTILFSIVHDITDRKNAEIALLEYADEILDLYDNAPCGYHSIDQAGFLIRINNTELNWLGYTRDQIIGKKRITDMMTAESLAKFHQSFPEFKNRGTIEGLEIDLIRENGTIMPVLINAIAIYDSEGAYVMSRSSLFDISQRKAAQNDLIESEQRFKSLAEASFEAIAISENGIVLDCNDNFSEISGYSHLELVGMNQMDLVVDEHKPNVWRIIKSESEEPYEAQWIKKDGSLITIAGRGKMASYKGRQVRVTSIRDITEIKNRKRSPSVSGNSCSHLKRWRL